MKGDFGVVEKKERRKAERKGKEKEGQGIKAGMIRGQKSISFHVKGGEKLLLVTLYNYVD